MAKFRILLTGGGSGGHVYPLLAVAEELARIGVEQGVDMEIKYMGPRDEYAKLLANQGIPLSGITAGKLRRYFSLANVTDIPKFFIGFVQALFKIYWFMPAAVFSKGGTGALPVVLASRFYRIPVLIHESDASPGLTNLVSSRFAKRIAVSFEVAGRYFDPKKTAWTGTPVRRELLVNRVTPEQAKEAMGFNPDLPLTVIMGGSLGSERINNFILQNLGGILKETQILHQTGAANYGTVEKMARAALLGISVGVEVKNKYLAVPYLGENIKNTLTAADLIVGRAGSGTIFEMSAFAKPAILIPLEGSAGDHQKLNAYEFSKTGAAVVIEEENLLPGIFLTQLRAILGKPDILNKMSLASSKFFKPDAAQVIAEELLRMI